MATVLLPDGQVGNSLPSAMIRYFLLHRTALEYTLSILLSLMRSLRHNNTSDDT